MLIGAAWIGLMTETEELDAGGICTRRQTNAWRTSDPDEAVRLWRAASTTAEVAILITPFGRAQGGGLKLAVALAQRGLPVSYGPMPAGTGTDPWVDLAGYPKLPRPELPPPDPSYWGG
jgi:hypothetical protein